MPKKLSHKEFLERVYNVYKDEYTVIGKYIKSDIPIEIKHNVCNKIWKPLPYNFLAKKSKCPYCAGNKKLTNEEFLNKVKNLVGDEYTVLEKIKNVDTKILFRHNICKTEFSMAPKYFLKGNSRCPLCQPGKTNKLTLDLVKKRIKDLGNNEYILIDENYVNIDTPILLMHKKCKNEYKVSLNNFQHGERCPFCKVISKGETAIKKWLEKENIPFIHHYKFSDCKYKRALEFDFYLEKYNLLIEYDGEQHYKRSFLDDQEQLELNKKRDEIKNSYCKEKNINLLRIPYWDFNKIEKILEERIGINER